LQHFLDKIQERRDDLEQKRKDIELTLKELDEVDRTCRQRLTELARAGSKEAAE